MLGTKKTNRSKNFENFECSGKILPFSCHFWNNILAFLQILRHSSLSWDITPLYFLSWSFKYFQQKESIKVQIWPNFTWTVKSLKFCTLMDSFCPNYIKFWLKMYERVISHDNEEWWKAKKTDLRFQTWREKFGECSPNHSKVWKFLLDGLFLPKVYKVWATKIQKSYLSWHWTVMQNVKKPWPGGFKNGMMNWVNFH